MKLRDSPNKGFTPTTILGGKVIHLARNHSRLTLCGRLWFEYHDRAKVDHRQLCSECEEKL